MTTIETTSRTITKMFSTVLFLSTLMLCSAYECGQVCECIPRKGLISCAYRNLKNYPVLRHTKGFSRLDLRFNKLDSFPGSSLLGRFDHIDIRGNPLDCEGIDFYIDRTVIQDKCAFDDISINCSHCNENIPESDSRRFGSDIPITSESSQPIPPVTIALSATGAISVCIIFGVSTGLCVRKRKRKERKRKQRKGREIEVEERTSLSISSSNVSQDLTMSVNAVVHNLAGIPTDTSVIMHSNENLALINPFPTSPPPPPPPLPPPRRPPPPSRTSSHGTHSSPPQDSNPPPRPPAPHRLTPPLHSTLPQAPVGGGRRRRRLTQHHKRRPYDPPPPPPPSAGRSKQSKRRLKPKCGQNKKQKM